MKQNHKLKIEVVIKYFYPVVGGAILNVLETYSDFVKGGWNVTVHATKSTLTQKNVLPKCQTVRGIKVFRYNHFLYNVVPLFHKINYTERDLISLHGCDILPHYSIYFYTLLLKILNRKKYLLFFTPHGLFNQDTGSTAKIKVKVKKLIDYTLGVFLINRTVDGIRAVSEWERNLLINAGIKPSLITVINNGLEEKALKNIDALATPKIKNQISQFGKYVIQLGRIHKIKNYETVLKALKLLPPEIKFLIVGGVHDKKYKSELLELIRKLGLEDRVLFLGVITGIKKYLLMRNSEMMVHMSRLEGFCNAVHEGMSQGLVCIVSKNTALEELITNGVNGYCLDPDDYQGLAKKINFVLKNKNSAKILEMKKRNKDFAAGHSWQNVAKEVEAFYKNVSESLQLKPQNKFLDIFAIWKT